MAATEKLNTLHYIQQEILTGASITFDTLYAISNGTHFSFGFFMNIISHAIQYGGIFTQGCKE
jgi:hypothetical protein